MSKKELICKLYDIQAIKVGDFTLASGMKSPVYFDLKTIISHPHILKMVANTIWSTVADMQVELLCGVPYNGLPIVTVISITQEIPLLLVRKEVKQHGTKKEVEGDYHRNQECLIIEDVVTTGGSVIKVAEMLRKNDVSIKDVAVLVDREQGAREALKQAGINLHAVFTAKEMFAVLKQEGRLTPEEHVKVEAFFAS